MFALRRARNRRRKGSGRVRGDDGVKIPNGIPDGTMLRLAGHGLPATGRGPGDLKGNPLVDIPRRLPRRQRRIYEQLRAGEAAERGETSASQRPRGRMTDQCARSITPVCVYIAPACTLARQQAPRTVQHENHYSERSVMAHARQERSSRQAGGDARPLRAQERQPSPDVQGGRVTLPRGLERCWPCGAPSCGRIAYWAGHPSGASADEGEQLLRSMSSELLAVASRSTLGPLA